MNAELEALILALESVQTARSGSEARRLDAIYQSRLDDLQARVHGTPRAQLANLIAAAHRRWQNAQRQHSAIPPRS